MSTIGAPPVGMTWCGVFAGTMSMSPFDDGLGVAAAGSAMSSAVPLCRTHHDASGRPPRRLVATPVKCGGRPVVSFPDQ
jgi:hypothetical protein